jgi:hypothetical protein
MYCTVWSLIIPVAFLSLVANNPHPYLFRNETAHNYTIRRIQNVAVIAVFALWQRLGHGSRLGATSVRANVRELVEVAKKGSDTRGPAYFGLRKEEW